MKTHIRQLIDTYQAMIDNLNKEAASLFNMQQVHPLSMQEEERQVEIEPIIKTYKLVISDLKKLIS